MVWQLHTTTALDAVVQSPQQPNVTNCATFKLRFWRRMRLEFYTLRCARDAKAREKVGGHVRGRECGQDWRTYVANIGETCESPPSKGQSSIKEIFLRRSELESDNEKGSRGNCCRLRDYVGSNDLFQLWNVKFQGWNVSKIDAFVITWRDRG